MKKHAIWLLTALCVFTLIACGSSDNTGSDNTSSSTNIGSSGTNTSSVSGSAVKGPIDNAEIKMFYFSTDGTETEIVAENSPVLTDPTGLYDFQLNPEDVVDLQSPLILKTIGGTMGGEPAPQLETIIPNPSALGTEGQAISRHMSTASSVAAEMLRQHAFSQQTAPLPADADAFITKVEDELEVDLSQDPADEHQRVAMVNLNVDENLDLFNSPLNNDAVDEYIQYLALNLRSSSGKLDGTMDNPSLPGEDMVADFDSIGQGRLAALYPNGPSQFLNLMAMVDKASILDDGVDVATITLELTNGMGLPAANGAQLQLSVITGEGSFSQSNPTIGQNPTQVTFTSTTQGQAVILASFTLDNGNTISQEIAVDVVPGEVNQTPVADAGSDQNVVTGSVVSLDGSQSSDANNDTLNYIWTLVSTPGGSGATLSDSGIFNPTFTADADGVYTLELVVNDGTVDSVPDTVTITASTANSAPTADAGPDQNVSTGSDVILDASGSSDADNDALTYAWTLVSTPIGSSAGLNNASQAAPSFTADMDGTYVAQLVVDDGTVDSTPDMVTITASTDNSAPTADAGPDQNVSTGSDVTLDASGSSDADNDALTYAWTLVSAPNGSGASLSNASEVDPSFTADMDGTYVAQLVVNDGTVDSAPDTVTITASTANSAPIADAGPDASVDAGTAVLLDGTGSSDADNDSLSYTWTLVSQPQNSAMVWPSPASDDTLLIVPDVAGTYVVQLVVNDETVDSAPDAVTITVADAGPDGAALYAANCAACHGADGTRIYNLRGITASRIENTLPHKGVTLSRIGGTAGAEAMAAFLGQ